MNTLVTLGRTLFSSAIMLLGIELLVVGNFPVALFPFPDFPGHFISVLILGLFFIVTGLAINLRWAGDRAAWGLGVLFLLTILYPHLPTLFTNLSNGNTWTVVGELMALSGGAFYLAGLEALPSAAGPGYWINKMAAGRCLLLISLIIFGFLHFQYAVYIATLIPGWIPFRLFWAYFVGVAFFATALSLGLNRQRTLATGLLGLMFALWVVALHAPRVLKSPQIEPEWTSLLIALAMSGIGFLIAGSNVVSPVERRSEALYGNSNHS